MTRSFLDALLNTLKQLPTTQRVWIAYSGGVDSHVLLHAIVQLRSQLPSVRAVHIHHGLNEQADAWVIHCLTVCQQMAIPCDVINVKIQKQPRQSLEALARQARYAAIEQIISDNDSVLTAQHADDQAETLLLQLLRGAGVAGLAAMPSMTRFGKGWLIRPLLDFTQTDLLNYAKYYNLQWIEDSSNQNTQFDRNFLRHNVMPLLKQRWKNIAPVLNRVTRHQAEADTLLTELAQQDYLDCQGEQTFQLNLLKIKLLSPARQRNLIRFWLKQLHLPIPTTTQLEHILANVIAAREDSQPIVRWQGGEVRRYQENLYAMANLPTLSSPAHFTWSVNEILDLPLGKLKCVASKLPENLILHVKLRQGGETCYTKGHQRSVKKLLQTAQLLPWLRAFQPLIYYQNILVAIPNITVCNHFQQIMPNCKIIWEYS